MKKEKIIKVSFLIGGLIVLASVLSAESVHLSTYYPAPFGAYDRLKLVPRDSLPLDPHCNDKNDLGTMYYDNGLNKLVEGIYACQRAAEDTFVWVLMSRQLLPGAQPLRNEKVVCIKTDGKFGVCMNNPSSDGTCGCQ